MCLRRSETGLPRREGSVSISRSAPEIREPQHPGGLEAAPVARATLRGKKKKKNRKRQDVGEQQHCKRLPEQKGREGRERKRKPSGISFYFLQRSEGGARRWVPKPARCRLPGRVSAPSASCAHAVEGLVFGGRSAGWAPAHGRRELDSLRPRPDRCHRSLCVPVSSSVKWG